TTLGAEFRCGRHPASAVVTRSGQRSSTFLAELCLSTVRSEEHTSELQSLTNLVCRLLLEKKKRDREYALRECRSRDQARAPTRNLELHEDEDSPAYSERGNSGEHTRLRQ